MINKIKQAFEKIGVAIEKYRFWNWLVAVIGFMVAISWAPNTVTSWPAVPFTIGLVALFFALYGEMVFSRNLFHADYFIFATAGMLFIVLYGMVFCIMMGTIVIILEM